ncbi:MAG: metallophosphoesterase [Nocardioidaceae bacterium]
MPSLLTSFVAALLSLGALGCTTPDDARPATTDGLASATAVVTAGDTAPVVVAVGDIACPPNYGHDSTECRQRATARLVGRIDPDAVIALGDLQYDRGRLRDFKASYAKSWGALKDRTLPIPGNHEYNTAGAKGYYTYFGETAPGYRVVTIGTWRVYLLNSNCDEIDCKAERTWMRTDMEANPTTCSAIALHFPRYSSGEHGNNASMSSFWKIGIAHGVDLALAGHDHDYERFAPMNASGRRSATGILSFVSGAGGRSLYERTGHPQGSRYFGNDVFGVLRLTLDDGSFSWKFRGLGGVSRDAGSHACH